MKLIMKEILNIAILVVFLITSGHAFAGSRSSVMNVSTRVARIFHYSVLYQKNKLTITGEDIERGFIDIRNGAVFSVTTNSRDGYVMVVSVNDKLLKEVTLIHGRNGYSLPQGGGEVHLPYTGKPYVTTTLSFRFYFSSNTKPGTYAWPVSMMLTSI
jgi:hypothetical protein